MAVCLAPLAASAQHPGYFREPTPPQVVVVEDAPAAAPTDEFRYTLYSGLNLSALTFKKERGEEDPDPHVRPAIDLGLRIDHYIYGNFSYYRSMGFRYSYGSYKVDFPDGTIRTTQHRFIVPFTIGVLGQVGNSYIGVGPNVHLGAAIGGTNHLEMNGTQEEDEYSAGSDESSFVCGLGAEAWIQHGCMFYSLSYNRSFEWYQMPEDFGDFKSNGRHMVSFNVGVTF